MKITTSFLRDLEAKLQAEVITHSRMVELINEEAATPDDLAQKHAEFKKRYAAARGEVDLIELHFDIVQFIAAYDSRPTACQSINEVEAASRNGYAHFLKILCETSLQKLAENVDYLQNDAYVNL